MKIKRWILSSVLVLACGNVFAQPADDMFFAANKYYSDGDYGKAVQLYEQVRGQGVQSGNLYYNLGNAYFKLGQKGKALLNYERAKRLISHDEDLFANTVFVESLLDIKQPKEIHSWYEAVFFFIRDMLSISGWFFASLVFFIAICIVTGAGFFCQGRKRVLFLQVILGMFLCAGLLFLWNKYNADKQEHLGIVIIPNAAARYSPSYSGAVAFELSEGIRVQILRQEQEWSQIRLNRKVSGWIESSAVEKI